MDFNYDKSWDAFENIFNEHLPIIDSWKKFIDFHEKAKPKKYWNEILNANLSSEKSELINWLNELISKNPIPGSIKALWIGIAQLYDEDAKREFYIYYFQGTENYEAEDIEWAAEPTYEPEEKYFVPEILNNIYNIIKQDKEDFSFLDWILPLSYSSFLFEDIFRNEIDKSKLFPSHNRLNIVIGYDGGDFKELSTLEKE